MTPADLQHLRRAEGWLGLGDWKSANDEVENISARSRARPEVLRVRFQVYEQAGQWRGAYEIARALCEGNETTHFDSYNFARAAARVGNLREAYRGIERAILLTPNQAEKNNVRLMALDNELFREMWAHISEI
jgi:uncharacterized protein HemY